MERPRAWMLAILILPTIVVGCASNKGADLFPLEIGKKWSSTVRTEFATKIAEMAITSSAAVGSIDGVQIESSFGKSKVAWEKGTLYASALPNCTFSPPIPLVVGVESEAVRSWKGRVFIAGTTRDASASLEQKPASLPIGGKTYETTRCILKLNAGSDIKIELITCYARGMGPIWQEQRTNDRLDIAMERING